MLFYEHDRVQLEKAIVDCTQAVDLSIAYSPVIAFPLTILGLGVEAMLDPVPVRATHGGLYLVESPFHEAIFPHNPVRAEFLAPMRARFLVVKEWFDRHMDLLPEHERMRAIALYFEGSYLNLGPRIQYRKRGQQAPQEVIEAWERNVVRHKKMVSSEVPISVHRLPPSPLDMLHLVNVASPETVGDLMQQTPNAVIVDVRGSAPDARELRRRYAGHYYAQGSWWKRVHGELADPSGGMYQVMMLLEKRIAIVLYCSCAQARNEGRIPCHRMQVHAYICAELRRLQDEREAQDRNAHKALLESRATENISRREEMTPSRKGNHKSSSGT